MAECVVNLVMGDDSQCVWCCDPRAFCGASELPPIPWKLCPTHYGKLREDPVLRDYTELEMPCG